MRVELEPNSNVNLKVNVYGEAVHSSVADEGHNAMWGLALVADRVRLCKNGVQSVLAVVKEHFAGDHWGERLALGYSHDLMGRLLVSPTMLRVEGTEVKLSVNMRRPAGVTKEEFEKRLERAVASVKQTDPSMRETGDRYVGDAALADIDGPLVPTLLEIYRRESKEEDPKPISIRGGTYARVFPGAVSFGPALPGKPYRGHAPDEYIELDALSLILRTSLAAAIELDRIDSKSEDMSSK
jgi:acetylornithine deacetylase/succinyl-diaminopimelate desuccinylase-like protein